MFYTETGVFRDTWIPFPRKRVLPGVYPTPMTVSVTDGMLFGENLSVAWITNNGPDGMVFGEATVTAKVTRWTAFPTDGLVFGDTGVIGLLPASERAVTDGLLFGDSAQSKITKWAVTVTDGMKYGDFPSNVGGLTSLLPITNILGVLL